MSLFAKPIKLGAELSHSSAKMVKAKPGKNDDGTRKKVAILKFTIKITKNLMERLGPRIGALVKMDGSQGAEQEIGVNFLGMDRHPTTCVMQIFSKQNYSKEAKPIVERGGAGEDQHASVSLEKIVNRENDAALMLQVSTYWDEKLWKWMGDMIGGAECVLALKPLQPELPMEGNAQENGKAAPAAAKEEAKKE